MRYVIGIDLGTSATKTVLFDEVGNTVASSSAEYPICHPQNGWAEQDPLDWWDAARQTLRDVITQSGVKSEDIVSLGISGQMHGLVMLDEHNRVLRPAIIWCDQRTAAECQEIEVLVGKERLIEITANPALTGFTASKIMWVKKHEPQIYQKCAHILLPKDYIRLMLTGEYATDVSDASGMQLLDVARRCWSEEVLDKLDIDISLLGKVYESPDVTGYVTDRAAEMTLLAPGTMVVGGAGDNAAAAVGTGTVEQGRAFTTIGTSGVVYAHTQEMKIDPLGRVHTFCCAVPHEYHVMGVTQSAGLSLRWLKTTCCSSEMAAAKEQDVDVYQIMDQEAATSPIGANKLLFLPYLMGERTPHLDPNARGVFFGLSAMHERRDLIRSVMEGVCYSLKDCLAILEKMNIPCQDMLACGGGSTSPLWNSMLADIYGIGVSTVRSKEGPALGVAILAMVGAGIYPDVRTACHSIVKWNDRTLPSPQNSAKYLEFYHIYKQLYAQLKDQYQQLNNIKEC